MSDSDFFRQKAAQNIREARDCLETIEQQSLGDDIVLVVLGNHDGLGFWVEKADCLLFVLLVAHTTVLHRLRKKSMASNRILCDWPNH